VKVNTLTTQDMMDWLAALIETLESGAPVDRVEAARVLRAVRVVVARGEIAQEFEQTAGILALVRYFIAAEDIRFPRQHQVLEGIEMLDATCAKLDAFDAAHGVED